MGFYVLALPAPTSVSIIEITHTSIEIKWTMDPRGRMKTKGMSSKLLLFNILKIIYIVCNIKFWL